MDQLQLTDFLRYRFLAQPKFAPDGQRAAFTVTNCNEEENCYETRLWLWEAGRLRQLTDLGKESGSSGRTIPICSSLPSGARLSRSARRPKRNSPASTAWMSPAARQPTPLPSPLPPGPFTTSPAPGIWRRAASTPALAGLLPDGPGRTGSRGQGLPGKPGL